jgi:dipeptidyl aminopeptidase/acylaminoacyl peptidase
MRVTRVIVFGWILAVVSAAVPAAAQERRPMTAEDLWAFRRVSDPQVSPDGGRIVFVVTEYDVEANAGNADLYVVDAAGGAPRRLTRAEGSDVHPRWSPDGRSLYFLAARDGVEAPQVCRLPLEGGDPEVLTDYPAGVGGFVLSPDGRRLAITTEVYPDCDDLACTRRRMEEREASGVRAVLTDTIPFRVWNTVREGRVSHLFVQSVDGTEPARDLTPGNFDCPPIDLGSSHDVAFSPDGAKLAYTLNAQPGVSWNTNNDVWEVPLATGGVVRRVSSGPGGDAGPAYSPDGRWLAWLSMERPGFEADRHRILIEERATGEVRELAGDLDRSAQELTWAVDSTVLYFVAADRGRETVFRVAPAGGEATPVTLGGSYRSVSATRDGKLVAIRETHTTPPEVVTIDPTVDPRRTATQVSSVESSGCTERTYAIDPACGVTPLDRLNEDLLARIAMPQAEAFWFDGAGGDRVHGWLFRPAGLRPGRKVPAVFVIHGGPQGAFDEGFHFRWNLQLIASPGYVVVAINFHGSVGFGQAFTDAVSRDWGGAPYEDILKGVDHVVANYPEVDGNRLAAIGASYGGFMVNWILGHTDRFRCLVSHAGVSELWSKYGATDELWFPEWEFGGPPWEVPAEYDRWSPVRYADRFATPTLVSHGELDYRVSYVQALAMFTALQRRGVPSRLLLFPDEDHFVRKPKNALLFWDTVFGWLRTYLDPIRPVWTPPAADVPPPR